MTEPRQIELPQAAKKKIALPLLFAAFLLTALVLLLVLPRMDRMLVPSDQQSAPLYTVGFADGYDLIANNLINGNGYRFYSDTSETMMREPGYPLFLAGAFKLGGYSIETARWANWILTIFIAFLMMRLSQIATNDRTISLIATLLFLLYPSTLIAEARGGVEILFILVVLIFMLALYRAVEKGDWWRYLIAGLALGAVVQVRSTPLVFPFFLLLYWMFFPDKRTGRLKSTANVAILIVAMLAVMTPWLVRNFKLVHHIVPTATVQGVALQEGQYTCQHLSLENSFYALQKQAGLTRAAIATELGFHFEGAYYYQAFYTPQDEWAFNQALFKRGEKQYIDHPVLVATCSCENVFNFWFLGKTWHATWLNMVVQVPLLALAAIGIFFLRKRGQLHNMGLVLTFIVSIIAVDLPIIAHARHSVPLVPFLAIPASVSAVTLWLKYRAHFQKQTASEMFSQA